MAFTLGSRIGAGLSGYVAELGAALWASLASAPSVRHADYLGNWRALLRADLSEDPAVRETGGPRGRAIFRAANVLLAFAASEAGEGRPEADKRLRPEADKRLRRAA